MGLPVLLHRLLRSACWHGSSLCVLLLLLVLMLFVVAAADHLAHQAASAHFPAPVVF
jgi:hypothetical protein